MDGLWWRRDGLRSRKYKLLSRRSAINEMRAVQGREKKNAFWVETQGHFAADPEKRLTGQVVWGILDLRQIRIRRKEDELWQRRF